MRVSEAGITAICRDEGLRLDAYPDPGSADGKPWTIGYGHTGTEVVPGLKITTEQAREFLREDLIQSEATLNIAVKVPLTQNQFDALASFVFNVGRNAFLSSTLLKQLNKGDYASVPTQLMRWTKNAGKEMPGLVKRRRHEVNMWNAA